MTEQLIWTDAQERRGAVLVAAGINPVFLRALAIEMDDVESALDIAERHPSAKRTYLKIDGESDKSAIKAAVEGIAAMFDSFGETLQTREERAKWVEDGYGVEGVDWEWIETPFRRKRQMIQK